MSDDLVKRLREPYTQRQSRRVVQEFAAADRIEELEAKLGEYNLLWQAYELDKVVAELKGQNDG